MVAGLKECQAANGDGYLSAYPRSHFDRLEALQPVWAPYYPIHKIMQGLYDQHLLMGDPDALGMVESMANYFCTRIESLIASRGLEYWHQCLNVEFGGMNEILYELFSETGNQTYASCAQRFDKPAFLDPLLAGKDPLPGLHANTHLAQVNGFAARFDALGDHVGAQAVFNFFSIAAKVVVSIRVFSTSHAPVISLQVVSWPQGDPGAIVRASASAANGAPNDPGPVAGEWKGEHNHSWTGWGDPFNTFWCCYGSGVESFSKLADSIYFQRWMNDSREAVATSTNRLPELYVNQMISSEVRWTQLGIRVDQQADLYSPDSVVRTTLTVSSFADAKFLLKLRVPGWTNASAAVVKVDGQEVACGSQAAEGVMPASVTGIARSGLQAVNAAGHSGFYCTLGPQWRNGSTVEASFPMLATTVPLNDPRPENANLRAIKLGPFVMAGVTYGRRDVQADASDIARALEVPPAPAALVSVSRWGAQNNGEEILAVTGGGLGSNAAFSGTVISALRANVRKSRATAMEATFAVRPLPSAECGSDLGSANGDIVPSDPVECAALESMAHPGMYLDATDPSAVGPFAAPHSLGRCAPGDQDSAQAWCLSPVRRPIAGRLVLSVPAAPGYPLGARILRGASGQYLLIPIGQVIDEQYTTYFDFQSAPAVASA
ncbi:hypothetical protein QBZ16_001360 [Prototheca wickerhamii]|uniref:Uncharacterized protein n=1 Tax=Prototheca wickerhamii TaxID=3111 RepID=A0AAD9IDG5_PROWI|nr:hypothetical protein QBZ16_001360 [Prototheca wickerhamii]